MNIDLHNYEEFIPDYLDGTLEPSLRRELEQLFIDHPHIRNLVEEIEITKLEPESLDFRFKFSLKKDMADLIPERFSGEEEFFIAKTEGELTAEEERRLKIYIESFPEKEKELSYFNHAKLVPEKIEFKDKNHLRKPTETKIPERFLNIDEFMIARLENELTLDEEKGFSRLLIENPELEKEYQLFMQTRLVPENIVFNDKPILKKAILVHNRYRRVFYLSASVAASILVILLFLFNINRKEAGNDKPVITNVKPVDANSNIRTQLPVKNGTEIPVNMVPGKNYQTAGENVPVVLVKNTENTVELNHHSNESTDINELKKYLRHTVSVYSDKAYTVVYDEKVNEHRDYSFQVEKTNPVFYNASSLRRSTALSGYGNFPVKAENEEYMNPNQYLSKSLKKNVLKLENPSPADKITLWDVAQAAVSGFRKITGRNVKIDQKYDSEGKVVRVAFNSRSFGISAPVRK